MTLGGNLCQILAVLVFGARRVIVKSQTLFAVAVVMLVVFLSPLNAQELNEDPDEGVADEVLSNGETPATSDLIDDVILEEVISEQDGNVDDDGTSESPLSDEVEDLKKAALALNRDLLILEEELLFPDSTQIVIFLSMDVGKFFRLDAVKLSVDDKMVASHLYTARQNDALIRGGIQRLYVGNVKSGEHEITAIITGEGPDNRNYKRGATIKINKDDDPKMVELRILDSTASMQPEFDFKEWQL